MPFRSIAEPRTIDLTKNMSNFRSENSSSSVSSERIAVIRKDHNVKVVIRIRPLSNSEISIEGLNKCVRKDNTHTITWTGHPDSRYTFDLVADENVTQENLFNVAGLPMVENCLGGYNSCIFAYGQTGSGKTYTMMGDIDGGVQGMTPRVFEHLFTRIQKDEEARKDEKLIFTCKCSYLQIYKEQILDLLDPSTTNLHIREHCKKGVYVENLKEMEVTCARDVIQLLAKRTNNRKVAPTEMNDKNSRSHSVFTCIIESKWEVQGVTHHRFARLNLVDLAGSKRQKRSGAQGERLKETSNINKSLSTLGKVIMNLVSISRGKSVHVNYRDSRLTYLIQDSLDGNLKTTMIANISPANCNSLETRDTLKFAQRAKFIKNNVCVIRFSAYKMIHYIQIQQLKKEVHQLRGLVIGGIENQEVDFPSLSFSGSPGSFKWEGLQGPFSPLTCDRKKPDNKEFEAALVGAFRREKEKQIAMQSLAAENQAAMQLVKRSEDKIHNLEMLLQSREAGIKRLEAVASGKMLAEVHFLLEKEENLREIEVLCHQVDSNLETTRFEMENLHLKEEIRRLRVFSKEGEREMMSEEIMILHSKLLEALDWKRMHESESSMDQSKVETLQKKLDSCLEVLENYFLRIQIDDLVGVLETEKRRASNMGEEARKNQMELKTMVDAISAASDREAKAYEMASTLAKENEELRIQVDEQVNRAEKTEDNTIDLASQPEEEIDSGSTPTTRIYLEWKSYEIKLLKTRDKNFVKDGKIQWQKILAMGGSSCFFYKIYNSVYCSWLLLMLFHTTAGLVAAPLPVTFERGVLG
ncbi:kinesin-like protein KIN-12E [Papaver somniferum]|uniref:kinesin-like protein KIN-12E n=1 Tax=Papaver somniferum TaxID=3469 RepID=UPI000E6FCFD2|nr:kinesin-like protein KIN-12E [Papaver somniferum]